MSVFETGEVSQADVERLIRERLVEPRWPLATLSSLRIEQQRFTPGKEMTCNVTLELSGGNAPSGRQQVVLSFLPPRTLKRVWRAITEAQDSKGFSASLPQWAADALPAADAPSGTVETSTAAGAPFAASFPDLSLTDAVSDDGDRAPPPGGLGATPLEAASNPGALVLDQIEGFVLEMFPMDWRLPALPKALDAAEMASRLRPFLQPPAYDHLDVRLMRYRPHTRALISLIFRNAAGEALVDGIGKIFATPGGAEDSWRALTAIAAQSGDRPVAPLPLHYDKEWRFVLMQRVPGRPMQPLLAQGLSDEGRAAVRLTADSLYRLHSMTVELELKDDEEPETRTLADELVEVRDQARKFARIYGWLSEEAFALCDRIEKAAETLPERPLQLVHGSFKGEQVIVNDGSAVIVDLDAIGLGDPGVDIGNFTAKQYKDARQPNWEHLDEYGQQLLNDYVARSGDPSMLKRCRLFEAVSLARLAYRELHTARRDMAEAREGSPSARMMDRARERLEEAERL